MSQEPELLLPERVLDMAFQVMHDSLDAFAERAFRVINPSEIYEWNWHIECIVEHLEAVANNEIRDLIINIPPRTLKTFLVSTAFPAWYLGRDPTKKFIVTSFKHERAVSMAQNTRHIMKDDFYTQLFPKTIIDPTQDEKHNFHTTQHGMYYSSAMHSATGAGGDIVICDDPLNPDEALSDTVRNSTNQTIRGTIFNRFNDRRKGHFILVMQRLHEDDPTGNLLKDGGYVLLKLPAEAPKSIVVQLPSRGREWRMAQGDLLFPQRLTKEILDRNRLSLTEYHYAGQYLQEPVPLGGGMFRDEWVNYYQPGGIRPVNMNIVILVDAAGGDEINKKKKKTSDYTAMMVVGLASDNNYYLLDIVRDRLNPTERITTLFMLHRKWNALTGKPPKCGYEKYGLMTDTHYIRQKMHDDGYYFNLTELGGAMDKVSRISRLVPDMQNGRWYFPANLIYADNLGRSFDLVHELVYSEMPTFPYARYDDMLDALSRVYDETLYMSFPQLETKERQNIVGFGDDEPDQQDWRSF